RLVDVLFPVRVHSLRPSSVRTPASAPLFPYTRSSDLNEVANPTYTNDLAEAIAALVETERYGIYHLVNEGACSRYELARYALERAGLGDTPVQKISSHQWSRPSTPPPYSALANMAGALVGIRLRPWQEAVDTFLAREQPTE